MATPFISVVLLGILWKRTNYSGAMFGMIGGLAIQVAFVLGDKALGLNLNWLYIAFAAQVCIMLGVVAVSLLTPAPSDGQCELFHWQPGILFHLDGGMKRPWYQSLRLWFAIYASIWCYLYWRFW